MPQDTTVQPPKGDGTPQQPRSVAALLLEQDKDEPTPKSTPVTPDADADEEARKIALQTPDDGSGPGKVPPADATHEETDADPEPVVDPDAVPDPNADPDAVVEEPVQGQTRKWKDPATGEEIELTFDEAVAGWMRTKDYTQKRQADAEVRRQMDQAIEQTGAERAKYIDGLTKLEATLTEMLGDNIDWEAEAKRLSPSEYTAKRSQYDNIVKRRKQVSDAREAEMQKQAKDAVAKRQQVVEQEYGKLLEAVPTWQDDAVRTKEFGAIRDDLIARGFPAEAIDVVDDHKLFLLARDAMLYRAIQKGKPAVEQKVTPKIKPAKPGAKPAPKVVDPKRAAHKALKESALTGDRAANRRAAATVFEQLEDNR